MTKEDYQQGLADLLDIIWSLIIGLPFVAVLFALLAIFFFIRGYIVGREISFWDIPQIKHARTLLLLSLLFFVLWVVVGVTGFQEWSQKNLKHEHSAEEMLPPEWLGRYFAPEKYARESDQPDS